MENVNLLTVFTTGLLTGGLTCMAVQGGLLTATIAQRSADAKAMADKEEEHLRDEVKRSDNAFPIIAFLIAKLIAYTLSGALLGWLGSLVKLSIQFQVALQIFVAVFMVGTALNMLNVHPLFRYFIIQPPSFLTRFIRKQAKRKDVFAPAFLGAFTIFIPCGTTQAMMALAIASGNPIIGAAVMFVFVLGTSPVFFLLGYLTTRLGDILHARFTYVAATAIILLSLFNLNNALALAGGQYTFGKMLYSFNCAISFCNGGSVSADTGLKPVDTVRIEFTDGGYSPNTFAVKRGTKVTMNLINNEGRGCIQAFTIPQLGIQSIIPVGSQDTIVFTAPDTPGEITFTCSMGMYPGTIKVI